MGWKPIVVRWGKALQIDVEECCRRIATPPLTGMAAFAHVILWLQIPGHVNLLDMLHSVFGYTAYHEAPRLFDSLCNGELESAMSKAVHKFNRKQRFVRLNITSTERDGLRFQTIPVWRAAANNNENEVVQVLRSHIYTPCSTTTTEQYRLKYVDIIPALALYDLRNPNDANAVIHGFFFCHRR